MQLQSGAWNVAFDYDSIWRCMCLMTVYEGVKSFYKESDEIKPVNVYGETKVAAEKYIQSNYSHFAILRSSIIYGPQPFVPLPKTLPVQVTM